MSKVLIVAGPRNFTNRHLFIHEMTSYFTEIKPDLVISGGATGVDYMAKLFCKDLGVDFREFLANWELHGKAAGPIRNREMAKLGTHLLAFVNGSPGTASMIREAKKANLVIKIVKVDEDD